MTRESAASCPLRRYDVDRLRTSAIGLLVASVLLPLRLPAYAKLVLMLAGTVGASLLIFEFVLKRLRFVRPFFGMKLDWA